MHSTAWPVPQQSSSLLAQRVASAIRSPAQPTVQCDVCAFGGAARLTWALGMNKIALQVLLSVLLSACVHDQSQPYQRLEKVPSAFLSSYPMGTQTRSIDVIQKTFERNRNVYLDVIRRYKVRTEGGSGNTDIVLALNPDGSVEAAAAISSSSTDPVFSRLIIEATFQVNFGAAPGEGYYVFWYPFHFRE